MTDVRLTIEYFNNPADNKPLSGGRVYIGVIDLDPKIEANRVSVTIQQEDGSDVVIAPSAQPITLSAGGRYQYLGSPVQVSVSGNYAMRVDDSLGNQVYYVPDARVDTTVAVTSAEVYLQTDTVATMVAGTIWKLGDFITDTGYISKGDGGNNSYEVIPENTGVADGGLYIDLPNTTPPLQAKGLFPGAEVRVEQFGAVVDGIADDTVAVNNASIYSNTAGIPIRFTGKSYITDKVTFFTGQRILGKERTESGFAVDSNFNLSATGIIDFGSVEPGPTMTDMGIFCTQNQSETVRANIIQYPPCILAIACPRFIIDRLRIDGANIGIDATGNSGGAHIINAEIGALTIGIDMNGAKDFMYLDNVQYWPFGIGNGGLYTSVYSDGVTIGANVKDVEGISFGTIGGFRARTVIDGGFGHISQLSGDGRYSNIEVIGGAKLSVATYYSSSDAADDFAIKVSGTDTEVTFGVTTITNATDLTASNGLIQVLTDATAKCIIQGLYTKTSGLSTRIIYMDQGTLIVDGGYLQVPQNVSLVNDLIEVTAGTIMLSDVKALSKGTGTGNIINIASDGRHSVTNISAPGWDVALPANSTQMVIESNEWNTTHAGTREIIKVNTYLLTGALDAAGVVTIAHGLAVPNTKNPLIDANVILANTNLEPVDWSALTGTNITLTSPAGATHNGLTAQVTIKVRE